jgi:hypothetical protein
MDDIYSIDVIVDGEKLNIEARLIAVGYTHRFAVIINEIEVIYEPDEERKYRAVVSIDIAAQLKKNDRELIETVALRLEQLSN